MTPKTRLVIVWAGLAIVTAAAATAWLLWSKEKGPTPSQTGSAAPASGPRAVAAARGPVAEIVLQVNGAARARVSAGSAVLFTVSLTGSASRPALRIGVAGRPWSADLRFETGDTGQPVSWRIDRLGQPFSVRFGPDPQKGSSTSSTQPDEAIVDDSSIHQIQLGVSPDEAIRIGSGTYSVRVVLSVPQNPSGETKLVSNSITLVVEGAESGAASLPAAEKTRLEAAARFHLRSGKWEDAHRIALQLVQRDTVDALAYVLLGDALNGLRRDDEALAAYREALAELPGVVDESPEYLIARMTEVDARLSAAKRGGGRQ